MDPSKHAPLRINDIRSKYKVIDKVGKGTYGTVYKVLNLQDNKYYAIKKFQNTDVKLQVEGFPITALREISLLKQLNHPNIVNLQEIICSKPNKRNLFRGSTFMVFEYMHHDFAGLFRSKIKFSVPQIKSIMKQLLMGCSFLHKNKVMHRDIKSANILLNDQGIVQLADFGLGRRTRFESVYTYKVVTLWYRAPELLLGCKTYNHKVDVWSIGCVFAELLTGQVLFKKQTQYAIIEKIYEVCGDLQQNEFTEDYLRGCVYYNDMKPKKSFKNTLSAFVKKINPNIDDLSIKFLQGLLELNPYKRLSCDEALQHEFFKTQPKACEPQQIHKLEVQYHEMFRDRSLKIERKARKQSLNWSEQEELRKVKQEKSDSQEKKGSRYPERDNKTYPPRNDRQKSYNDRPYDRNNYNRYGSRYDERKKDYVQKEYSSSRNYEDEKYKKRYSKSPSRSQSSSQSSSRSRRSRSRNNRRYYEDRNRQYIKRQDRERGNISIGRKESRYYDDQNRQKERTYVVKEKLPEYTSKSYEQRTQSYKKDYYQEESKNRSYQSRERQRRDYPRNQIADKKQYSSRTDKYSRDQYERTYPKSGQKQRYPQEGKSKSYQNDKYESRDYRPKDQYRNRQEIKEKTSDYRYQDKYEKGEIRTRKDDDQKPYKQDYDKYSKPYSKQYRSEYPKKQYYSSKTQKYSDERRPYEKSREKEYRNDKVSRQYEKEPYDYSKQPSRYREDYRYKEDYRYQDQPRFKENYRDDSKYRDESRYRDDRNKEFLNKKISVQSRQSTQKKKSSPINKAMDVQQQY